MRTLRLRTRAITAGVSVVALAALTACGSDDSGSSDSGDSSAATEQTQKDSEESEGSEDTGETEKKDEASVPKELDFTTKTVAGEEFEGASLAGKNAVMWFWAPWCTTCAAEAPHVKKVAEEHGDDVTFVGIPGKGEVSEMKKFVADHELDGFDHAVDSDGSLWSTFGVAAQPATAFIDKTGKVDVVPGTISEADLNKRIGELTDQ